MQQSEQQQRLLWSIWCFYLITKTTQHPAQKPAAFLKWDISEVSDFFWSESVYAVLSTSPGQPLLLLFLPSNGPLLGIPQVSPLKMKQQNIARLWMPWVEDKTYQKGQQVDIPQVETEKLWGERRGCVLSLFLGIFLGPWQRCWVMDLCFDFRASWCFYSLKDILALETDPWIPVLAKQKTVSTARTSTVHFLLRLPVCLSCWYQLKPEMTWSLVQPVCELVLFSSKPQSFLCKMGNRGWMAFWKRELA